MKYTRTVSDVFVQYLERDGLVRILASLEKCHYIVVLHKIEMTIASFDQYEEILTGHYKKFIGTTIDVESYHGGGGPHRRGGGMMHRCNDVKFHLTMSDLHRIASMT